MNKLLILIITYNSKKYIHQCLSPFLNLPENWRVVVVDNKSTDDTVDIIKNNYPFVKIIENKNNSGFGAANNIGLSYALKDNFEHVFLLNHDATISIEEIEKLIKLQKENPEYYILSPIHLDASKEHLDCGFVEYMKSSNEFLEDAVIGKYKKNIYEVGFINAAMWLLSNECIKKIGGFSPTFYHYGEDDNYIQRVKYFNKKCGIVPTSKGIHDRANRAKSIFDEKYTVEYREICKSISNPSGNYKKSFNKVCKKMFKRIFNINYLKLLLKLVLNNNFMYENYCISKAQISAFLCTTFERERESNRARNTKAYK